MDLLVFTWSWLSVVFRYFCMVSQCFWCDLSISAGFGCGKWWPFAIIYHNQVLNHSKPFKVNTSITCQPFGCFGCINHLVPGSKLLSHPLEKISPRSDPDKVVGEKFSEVEYEPWPGFCGELASFLGAWVSILLLFVGYFCGWFVNIVVCCLLIMFCVLVWSCMYRC